MLVEAWPRHATETVRGKGSGGRNSVGVPEFIFGQGRNWHAKSCGLYVCMLALIPAQIHSGAVISGRWSDG